MPPPEEVQQLVVIPFSTETLRELSGRGFPDVSHALDSYIRRNLGEVADKLGRGVTVIIINETGNSNSHMSPPPIQPLLWNQRPSVSNEHAPIPAPEAIVLSAEQQEVLDTVRAGGSVFFTGPAGTGKSALLGEIIKLRGGRASQDIGITAATGIAAVNIGGMTLHSWGGIGLGRRRTSYLIRDILEWPSLKQRWIDVKTLIIDEISMIDGRLFDKLETIARNVRGDERPFGGIQLVLSGDFCQLPPVSQRDKKGETIPPTFAFDAKKWGSCVGKPVTLKQVFRQKDKAFVEILNTMRFGRLNEDAKATLGGLSRKIEYGDGIEPTELFPTRREVDSVNHGRLQQLSGPTYTYVAKDLSGHDSDGNEISLDQAEKSLRMLVVPKIIQLRVGAQVMLIKNIVQGVLVNGTVGRIIKFISIKEALNTGIEILKSNSSEYTYYNQLCVYRSRHDDLHFNYATISKSRRLGVWPVVEFLVPLTPPYGSKRTVLCVPEGVTVNNAIGGIETKRVQVPLILAWALSVHKSQGQTLDRVKVDLARTFEYGQAYVALSRARTMEHLQVFNFHESKVMAHERVLDWHRQNFPGDSQSLQDLYSEKPEK